MQKDLSSKGFDVNVDNSDKMHCKWGEFHARLKSLASWAGRSRMA